MKPSRAILRYEKRRAAVAAVQRGESPEDVARVLGIGRSSLFTWLSRYRHGGWDALRDGKKSGRPRKMSAEVIQWLYDTVTGKDPRQMKFDFALWSLRLIRVMLKREHGITLSKSSLCRLMGQLGLTPQKPLYRAYAQDPEAVQRWKTRHWPRLKKAATKLDFKPYFIDESGLRSDSHRGATWAKRGKTPVVGEHRGRHGLNMISAVNPLGQLWFRSYEGRMDSEKFIEFLEGMLADIEGKILLIADNSRVHTSRQTRAFVHENRARLRLVFLPKYAPELNPDEQVWNHTKRALGKKTIANKNEMQEQAHRILDKLAKQSQLIVSFFHLHDTRYILA